MGVYQGIPVYLIPSSIFMEYPHYFLTLIPKFQITHLGFPNFVFKLLVETQKGNPDYPYDLSSLKTIVCGGELAHHSDLNNFIECFKPYQLNAASIIPAYGMTETCGVISGYKSSTNRYKTIEKEPYGKAIVSNGGIKDRTKIRIANKKSGLDCKEGEIGDIYIAGEILSLGYLSPEMVQKIKKNEKYESFNSDFPKWINSGDVGFMQNGELYIVGRKKDIIIIRGRKYNLVELEQLVRQEFSDEILVSVAMTTTINSEEKLILLSEVHEHILVSKELHESLKDNIRSFLVKSKGISPYKIIFLDQNSFSRSNLGKINRGDCTRVYSKIALNSSKFGDDKVTLKDDNHVLLVQKIMEFANTEDVSNIQNKSLIAIGFDSLSIARYCSFVNNTFGTNYNISDFFQNDFTLEKLLSQLKGRKSLQLQKMDIPSIAQVKNMTQKIELTDMQHSYKSSDSILALSELSFDLSVYDIFGMLAVGGTIVMPESRMAKDPESWHKLVTEHNISIWNTVPALMEMYAEYVANISESNNICIRLALLSGDWIPLSLPTKLKALNPKMEIISLGGATEASIWSIYFPINRVCKEWQSIPYGKPLANQTILILDELLKPCPIYATGSIYIGGMGVANGYHKDKEKTERSFLKLKGSDDIIYKTGDLGRMLPDGNVEFLGRADSQVKIGGYRIELGEIEACISNIKGVNACVVVLTKSPKMIRAFVQLDSKENVTTNEIIEKLSLVLPHYMIPQEISIVSTFPLTSNGKIDRKRLSEETASYNNSKNRMQGNNTDSIKYDIIIDIFAEMLEVDRSMIDINQNFFSMGGDSILGVKIISKLKEHGIILSPRMIFEHPTIRDLMEAYVTGNDEKIMPKDTMQLSAYQQILINKYGDEIFAQNHVVLLELKGQINPEKLDQGVSTLCPLFDTLKGKLSKSKDKWELHIIPNCSYEIDFVDKIPENTSFDDYIESITNEFVRDFSSGETPLLRICLLKHKTKNYLLIVSNKLILDLYSVDLLLKLLFNNMYYGMGISKEITEQIASLNDIASLYILQDSRFAPKPPIEKQNKPFSVRMRDVCLRKIEDIEIISLLIKSAVSHLKHTDDNLCDVRYTIPRDYESLLEYSLEGTCGNFLMTYALPLRLNDISVNYNELKKMILTKSINLDMQEAANIHISENVPSIEIVYYGNMISRDTPYYNIVNLKNDFFESHSNVTIEAFVLNDQLDLKIFIEESANSSDEIQKKFEKILLEEFEILKQKSTIDAIDFKGLKISKEDLNELISK